jgi:hypothetical protein
MELGHLLTRSGLMYPENQILQVKLLTFSMAADQSSGLFWMKWQELNSLSLLGIEPLLSNTDNSVF